MSHAPLNYNKWDAIDSSDDEDDAKNSRREDKPLLGSNKDGAVLERDRATAARFMQHMKQHNAKVPEARRSRLRR